MQAIQFEGLTFRPFDDDDASAFAAAARESVASVGRWMPWCTTTFSEQDALAWFQTCRIGRASDAAYEFGIFSPDSGEFLGGCGLNAVNQEHLFCNLGYWIRQSAQRQGVARRSVQALKRHAFDTLGLRRLEIVVAEGNVASEGVARQAGAQFEGVARNRLHLHGTSVPALIFSLIPDADHAHQVASSAGQSI